MMTSQLEDPADVEKQDDLVIVKKEKQADGRNQLVMNTDYVLVTTAHTTEHAAVLSSFERFGTHLLIWLAAATSLWGAIFVVILSATLHTRKKIDPTLIICIPLLMVWALASMWSAYKNRQRRKALCFSFIPVVVLLAILAWVYVP